MEGHVRKRGDKWYYSFEAGSIDGKRKRIERVGGRTKKEAEAALRKALQEYENTGSHFEPTEITVADYMDYWYKEYVVLNCKYHTRVNYEIFIRRHIKPALGIYKLKSVTPAMLQEFINAKFIEGYSKDNLTNLLCLLGAALKAAVFPYQYIKDNPVQYVTIPKYENIKKDMDLKTISKEDFNRIIERFPSGSQFYIGFMIGYYTGFRIAEVTGLTWDDIDLENCTIEVEKIHYKRKPYWYFGTPKTPESYRTIPIGKTLVDALKKHKKWQMENKLKYGQHYMQQYEVEEIDEKTNEKLRRIYSMENSLLKDDLVKEMKQINFVSTKENGEIITPDSFKYANRVIHYELGIDFSFHALRHTHATMLIENGANMKDVQARLGHSKLETTMNTYTHATKKMAMNTVEIFEGIANHSLPTK